MDTHSSSPRVVVTGSSRGIGRGLAEAFLALGCRVTVSGRSEVSVRSAVADLAASAADRVFGTTCDVSSLDDVEALWKAASERFGGVDVWINNAGQSHSYAPFWELPSGEIESAVATNVIGTIYGTQVAVRMMRAQGHGAVFNMEGLGSDGRIQLGTIVYGATKSAVAYFTRAAIREAAGGPVRIGVLSPGMVVTDLLMGPMGRSPEDLARARRIFNIIADRVETVTPWLAARVLASRRHGEAIRWLTGAKVMARFLAAPFRKRDVLTPPTSRPGTPRSA
jgi:NAD(P)-dependent dehydrogenase (short-subunit alcohol dehydrogenase family)